jgi:MFS family permease
VHEEEVLNHNQSEYFLRGKETKIGDSSSEDSSESTAPILRTTKIDGSMNNWQRSYTLFLFSITSVLLFADQNLLAPNLSAAAEEFGYDNNERDKKLGGDIALAFFLLGAPASFLVGCGADSNSISRSFLFGITVLIGEGACFLTYFTTTYTGLYITRALTGFSVGGALPLLSSVLGDLFPPHQRSKVMASVGVGTGLGIALGQGIAGFFGPIYGWRFPFLIVSIPALVVAILVMTTVKDPVRGGCESEIIDNVNEEDELVDNDIQCDHPNNTRRKSPLEAMSIASHSEPKSNQTNENGVDETRHGSGFKRNLTCLTYASHFQTTKELLQSKTVWLTLIQGAPGCVPWGIVNTFLNDYLSEDCGLSVQAATTIILLFGLGNFLGMLVGGVGGDILYKKDSRYPSLLSGTMAIVGCFPLWILINTINVEDGKNITFSQLASIGLTSTLAGIGSGVTGPIVKATLQNVTLPNARGQAFALLNTFDDFGRGLGPVFVANLIMGLGSRQAAFNVGIFGWILCGIFNFFIFCTVEADEETKKQRSLQRYSQFIVAQDEDHGI